MPELVAEELLFLRGDLAKANNVSERTYSEKQVFDSMLIPATERSYYTEDFPLALPLEHEVRIGSLTGPPTNPFESKAHTDPIVSDTKEVAWYTGLKHTAGLVTVDTPRSQALIGFVKGQDKATRNLSAEVRNSFSMIPLSSMDEQPIANSAKLIAGGRRPGRKHRAALEHGRHRCNLVRRYAYSDRTREENDYAARS